MRRRLTTIVAADVVGYTRLIRADEEATLRTLATLRAEIIDPRIAERGGRIFKAMGDGVLAEFPSVVEAVRAAAGIQRAIAARNADLPAARRMHLRIGANLGDVVVDGDDLVGDGVNVASRIENLAEAGGMFVSASVHDHVRDIAGLAFEDLGANTVKNIDRPIHVWRWVEEETAPSDPEVPGAATRRGSQPATDGPRSADKVCQPPRIAVLPFATAGAAPDEARLADGFAEDVIDGLARYRSLTVIARHSSFAFRDGAETAAVAGRLEADFIVRGTLGQSGARLSLAIGLEDARTGARLWGERREIDAASLFEARDDAASGLAAAIVGRVEAAGMKRVLRKAPSELATYELFLRGLAHLRDYGPDDNRCARKLFEVAVANDAHFALAQAHLALALVCEAGYATAPPETLDRAAATAAKAIALDPAESACHRILGLVDLYRQRFEASERHFRRALSLNPSDADTTMQLGGILARRGRPAVGLPFVNRAMSLNPIHPPWYAAVAFIPYYMLGRYDEAAALLSEIPNPGPWTRARLAACFAQAGRAEEAREQADALRRERADFSIDAFLRDSVVLEHEADRRALRDGLANAGLE